jgi:hypothetical protein
MATVLDKGFIVSSLIFFAQRNLKPAHGPCTVATGCRFIGRRGRAFDVVRIRDEFDLGEE